MKDQDQIYVGGNARVTAISVDSGEVLWEKELFRKKFSLFHTQYNLVSLLERGDSLFAFTRGHVFRIDPSSGKTLWKTELKHLKYEPGVLCSKWNPSTSFDILGGSEALKQRMSEQ